MSARTAEARLIAFYDQQDGRRLHNLIRDQFEADRKTTRRDGVTVQQFRDMLAKFPKGAIVKVETMDVFGDSDLHDPSTFQLGYNGVVVIAQA